MIAKSERRKKKINSEDLPEIKEEILNTLKEMKTSSFPLSAEHFKNSDQ